MLNALCLVLCFIIVYYFFYKSFEQPVLGIYKQCSKYSWIKFVIAKVFLYLRKQKPIQSTNIARLEQPQVLSENIHAVDAVYFNGCDSQLSWLVCGTARRRNRLVNGFFYLKIREFSDQLLISPKLPDTCLRQSPSEEGFFQAEGIKLTPVEPMKSWKIEYNGLMRFEQANSQHFNVKLNALWTTDLPFFNFATDMSPGPVARAMSKELWSKEYFNNLKQYHQTHYEHFGKLKGGVEIDGIEYPLNLDCMRDHSFGKQRNWKNFHRYVMHFIHLENGDRITVGRICMPVTFSSLEVGFVSLASERRNHPITEVQLELFQHGEHDQPPTDYAFRFSAGGVQYTVQVLARLAPHFFLGIEQECRIVEQLCDFKVNGLAGWGAAEWQYRNFVAPENVRKSF
ncbi:uncharacterized protein LOC129743713 [Uranotaenia lowii]|uniref:uncharacterized protein LOC129743713 n=1 Tax=Uranotaenia lowii TaxID=190385 RepID=UPI002479700D|nr:uncharacterized protein LOC129743713 [Uranotaenia lowii]